MNLIHSRGLRLLLPFLLLPGFMACQEEKEQQKEPTFFDVYGSTTCAAVTKDLSLNVKCDFNWDVSVKDANWISLSRTVEEDGGVITLQVKANHGEEARTATLEFTSGSKTLEKTITQEGVAKFFQPGEIHLVKTAAASVTFDAPFAWTVSVSEGESWIDLKTQGGETGYAKVILAAKDDNENVGDRKGSLSVTIGQESFSIPVIQSQKDVLLADQTQVEFDYKGGEFSVLTQSNVTYKIDCEADWIHHIETKSLNEATELFSVDRNDSYLLRQASITFTPTQGEASSVTVVVVQDHKDPFLFLTMPGFYNVGGKSYTRGDGGWNLTSRVQKADGSVEFRLLNSQLLSVLRVWGYDPAAEEGSEVHVYVTGWTKSNQFLLQEYDVIVLGADDELIWLKNADGTGFIIQK